MAWICWGMHGRAGMPSVWDRWGRVQVVVSVGLAPVLAAWFGQVPLAGVIANLVAVPWISFVTVPLVLAGALLAMIAPLPGGFLLSVADSTLALLWPFLTAIAREPLAAVGAGAMPKALLFAGAGAALLLLPRGMPGRWLGFLWMLPLWLCSPPVPPPGALQLAVLDVGQGLAAIVRTHGHVLLYDTGPVFGPDFNAGDAVVLPWLRHAGVARIDTVVLSHDHADHTGGFDAVRAALPVRRILAGAPERVFDARAEACRAGQHWHWDGFDFTLLHPPPGARLDDNETSCVLRIAGAGTAVLLTGDIEREAEAMLLRRAPRALRAEVLVVPHHGSRTSSSQAFVAAVKPRYALYAAGYRNRFGFPKQDIMQRYQEHGAINLDTGRHGALDFRIDAAGVRYSSQRAGARRFWHARL